MERKYLRVSLEAKHSGKLCLLKCNTRTDLLNQQGWKCTWRKSTKLILVSSCNVTSPAEDVERKCLEHEGIYPQHFEISESTKIIRKEIWATRIDIVIPFKRSHSSKEGKEMRCLLLLVKIFHRTRVCYFKSTLFSVPNMLFWNTMFWVPNLLFWNTQCSGFFLTLYLNRQSHSLTRDYFPYFTCDWCCF